MSWQNRTIGPLRSAPPKVNIRYPCPALSRLVGTVSFGVIATSIYVGGARVLGLQTLDPAAPDWTPSMVGVVVAAFVGGGLALLAGFATAMAIEVRSERVSDFITISWQFLANGALLWMMVLGTAMSIVLGRDEAKTAVLHFGAERAALHVFVTGGGVGLLIGFAFFLAPIVRMSFLLFFAWSATVAMFASRWFLQAYGIEGRAWIAAGLIVPVILLVVASAMVERDRRQRRVVMESA